MAEHIADTSSLSYLFRTDALDLLRVLFGTILVPTDVEAELRVGREQGYALPDPVAYSWMNVRDASPPPPRLSKLGRGESAVIGLAVELSAKGTGSDTHGLLRPEAVTALQGSDRIIHAGDVGAPEVLSALAELAPVTAVRGNNDHGTWARAIATTEVVDADGLLIYVIHDVKELDLDPAAAGFRVVVSGHSHRPAQKTRDGALWFDPGSAGTAQVSTTGHGRSAGRRRRRGPRGDRHDRVMTRRLGVVPWP